MKRTSEIFTCGLHVSIDSQLRQCYSSNTPATQLKLKRATFKSNPVLFKLTVEPRSLLCVSFQAL